ncbi:hypothetical protein [Pseudomonas sp. NA-150]
MNNSMERFNPITGSGLAAPVIPLTDPIDGLIMREDMQQAITSQWSE